MAIAVLFELGSQDQLAYLEIYTSLCLYSTRYFSWELLLPQQLTTPHKRCTPVQASF
jgi:hypothetical protein